MSTSDFDDIIKNKLDRPVNVEDRERGISYASGY
jgi:hypothetical protein